MALDGAACSVVAVGKARGFVIETPEQHLVITAAHCLPFLPPSISASYFHERTYRSLLGKRDAAPSIDAECLFVDPVADIAVLGPPDSQALWEEAENYESLMDGAKPLTIGEPPEIEVEAWLLSLDNQWFGCMAGSSERSIWIAEAEASLVGGMSGSPILAEDGSAIGVMCISRGSPGEMHTSGGPNPRLTSTLPGWLLRKLNSAQEMKEVRDG